MDQKAFENLWQQQQEFQFALSQEKEKRCIYAQHFAAWADALCQEERNAPTHIGIAQKMLLATRKYFEWRAAVPRAHRDRISERHHVCIFTIFEQTFQRLKVLELALTPEMLFLPAPPPALPTKVTKIYKIDKFSFPIGEVEDEDEEA